MEPETHTAIEGVRAQLEMEVLRLNLKLRRYDRAQSDRLKVIEDRLGIVAPPPIDGNGYTKNRGGRRR